MASALTPTLTRPVAVLERKGEGGTFDGRARVYGARDAHGTLLHSVAKPGAPETIPTFTSVPVADLIETLRANPASHSVLEYNGSDHFTPWILQRSAKLKLRKLSGSGGVLGEITDVAKDGGRGRKVQGGRMLMYGAHQVEVGRGASVAVPGRAKAWAARYNPSGARADVDDGTAVGKKRHSAMRAVAAHAGALERLEAALLPEAAAARRAIADGCDAGAEFRVDSTDAEGQPTKSAGMSLSLTHGCADWGSFFTLCP